jgi:hypothetical protein
MKRSQTAAREGPPLPAAAVPAQVPPELGQRNPPTVNHSRDLRRTAKSLHHQREAGAVGESSANGFDRHGVGAKRRAGIGLAPASPVPSTPAWWDSHQECDQHQGKQNSGAMPS